MTDVTALAQEAATDRQHDAEPNDGAPVRIPAPVTIRELIEMPEPEERWLVEGLLPHNANNLWAGYPKTFKTFLLLELAISLATATPFLGRYTVPERKRVGLVLMEDTAHRVRRRAERIAEGRGLTLEDLDGWLFFWFRPPLRFSSAADMAELEDHVHAHALDYLHVDSWSYVSTGNSNDADDVSPQLSAFSRLRDASDGLTVGLTHHARKTMDGSGDRLTDLIRNSGHFGAWYDVGMVLSRSDESSPVKVRTEMRDLPSVDPFMFTVEDQYPAGPDTGPYPGGWLQLQASDRSPAVVEREAAAARFVPAVIEYLTDNPGCSKAELRRGITGDNALIGAAFDSLCDEGRAHYVEPEKRGVAGQCSITPLNRAGTPLTARSGDNPADPADHTPRRRRGGGGAGYPLPSSKGEDRQRGCLNPECSNAVGRDGIPCSECYGKGWREGQGTPGQEGDNG